MQRCATKTACFSRAHHSFSFNVLSRHYYTGCTRRAPPSFCLSSCSSTTTCNNNNNNVIFSQFRDKSYVLKFLRGHLPEDLKDVQGAIGCLYGTLPDVDEYSAFVVPQPLVESYHQVGYTKLPQPILDPLQVDKLADEVDELANNKEHHPKTGNLYATSLADLTGGPLFFCQGQWRASWGMHDLIYMPSLTVAASQLLGNSIVRLWYDEAYMKQERKGPCIPWQQNFSRWQHVVSMQNHVTCLIALDTLTKDRGALCLIPGSHRWREGQVLPPVTYDPSKDEAQQMNTIWDIVDEEESEMVMDTPPETINMKRGEAIFIHPLTLYATHGNRTLDKARFLTIHFMGKGVCTVTNGPVIPRTTNYAEGVEIAGAYFPVVFDPALSDDLELTE